MPILFNAILNGQNTSKSLQGGGTFVFLDVIQLFRLAFIFAEPLSRGNTTYLKPFLRKFYQKNLALRMGS